MLLHISAMVRRGNAPLAGTRAIPCHLSFELTGASQLQDGMQIRVLGEPVTSL